MEERAACGGYVGEVKQQLRDGFGLYVYPNSFFRYEGEWKSGKKHGNGKLLMKDGSYYAGEFVNGEIEGNGVRYWAASGNEYCGQFTQGEIHGYGVMKYLDGNHYEGEFHYGARTGYGTLIDKERQIYRGSFHNHKKHGEGEIYYKNGDHYQGNWVLDRRQGHGMLQCADSSLYEGQWRNDLFNGRGCMIHCSSVVYDGMWINGRPAAEATKLVILGEEIQEVVQGSPFTIQVQLQSNEGEVVEAEIGRALQIWAGVKHVQLPLNLSTSSLELRDDLEESLVETPFGYDAISYPLMKYVPESVEVKTGNVAATKSETSTVDSLSVKDGDVNETKLDLPAVTGDTWGSLHGTSGSSLVNEEKGTKQQDGALYGCQISPSEENSSIPTLSYQKAECGYALFQDIVLAPPPVCYRPFVILDELEKKASKKSSNREVSDKGSVSQEKITESRSDVRKLKTVQSATDLHGVRPGEYIIMVKDMTTPPFLGRTLSPAFILLKVIPQKANKRSTRKESHKVPSKT
uniref:MORN repeat-containing protein 1-like isoform X2 n=1 Tax=Pristiophorus japonicus TaxID=55135 RepID=UPI00398E5F2E